MKHINVLLAALVVVLGIHSFTHADAPAGVQKWEYKMLQVPKDFPDHTDAGVIGVLNKTGADGWEMVNGMVGIFIFKRPLK